MSNILFTAVIIVVVQRFAADPVIVSDLAFRNDEPKGKAGSPRLEGSFEVVRQMVWGMLSADNVEMASTSPRGLASMMNEIVVTCQEFGLTVTEKKTEAIHL